MNKHDNIVELIGDDGRKQKLEWLDCIEYEYKEYAVLTPDIGKSEIGEVVILECQCDENGNTTYIGIEDPAVLEILFSIFKVKWH